MALRVGNAERFEQILLSEWGIPRWLVVSGFFGQVVECLSKLLELRVAEFGRSSRWLVLVERVFEIALFEPIQPPIHRLFVPSVLRFDLGR